MNTVNHEFADWRSYRKFYAKSQPNIDGYYLQRLEEMPLTAGIVMVCGVFAMVVIIAVIFK